MTTQTWNYLFIITYEYAHKKCVDFKHLIGYRLTFVIFSALGMVGLLTKENESHINTLIQAYAEQRGIAI